MVSVNSSRSVGTKCSVNALCIIATWLTGGRLTLALSFSPRLFAVFLWQRRLNQQAGSWPDIVYYTRGCKVYTHTTSVIRPPLHPHKTTFYYAARINYRTLRLSWIGWIARTCTRTSIKQKCMLVGTCLCNRKSPCVPATQTMATTTIFSLSSKQ